MGNPKKRHYALKFTRHDLEFNMSVDDLSKPVSFVHTEGRQTHVTFFRMEASWKMLFSQLYLYNIVSRYKIKSVGEVQILSMLKLLILRFLFKIKISN